MSEKICSNCGRKYERSQCPFCVRERLWEEVFKRKFVRKWFPPRLQKDVLSNYITEEKLESILDAMDGNGLYVHGPSGCGKTVLSANLTLLYAKRRWLENTLGEDSILFLSVPNLLQEIKQTFSEGSTQTEAQIIQRTSTIPWLVLDDLGVEKVSEWVLQTLYLIINARYENLLPTVITSNFSLDELSNRLGSDRIPSRIAGMCEVLEMKGRDRRIERRNEK